ncbi:ACT domain-containing protein [Arvimicrobium flavum]|uniref:ACT domain-containing protein n=1 Tax=Arvimicrobium flavum TaxID=3393320 RepID=UPI00237BE899|nr:ACT domain-containing protein [Mesorhizobium shangrilense]
MSGEKDLGRLLATMRPALLPGEFVFAILPHGRDIPQGVQPVMSFREAEGMTLIVSAGSAEAAGMSPTFPSRMITLQIHSSLEAVGFLAAITARLAAAGISVNPVSAYHHDHLFVPADRADEAMRLLEAMAAESAGATQA